ncbi:hypothetical protein F7Q99_06505 [Streptomyces kaniharaensis]|uniref:Trypsin-like serine protease n=1 Tax=Streptomyces kaniharaensis TaxID=212423 RepID=A0A6N7KQS3_9ACTN|nr:trypsin-like peptidase domain-containing protein [Streptomyces kaniharaensis]MQS11953.1 hypothetical protein [Streptomyces kaniharaensis]
MSSARRAKRSARAVLGTAALALTVLTTTSACGPDNSPGDAATTAAAANNAPNLGLPANLDDLKKWNFQDWEKWAKDYALPAAVKGYWTLEKILSAKPVEPRNPPTPGPQPTKSAQPPAPKPTNTQAPTSQPSQSPDDGNDPLPTTVNAQAVPHPYAKNLAVNGKILFDEPGSTGGLKGSYECSGTVVADPAHPGKSNLVWTAAHCVHQGKGGAAFSHITFIPGFNSSGALSGGKKATELSQFAPYGAWAARGQVTSPVWKAEGGEKGNAASQYDFAILRVEQPDGDTGKSLEETVGGAVPVWFNAPRDQLNLSEYGYPGAAPYDGLELNHCESGRPVRLSFTTERPAMLAVGCSMTGGSSGGGWFTVKDGKQTLVSNVSIGKHDGEPKIQAGPYLDDVAKGMFEFISKKG